MLDQSKKEENKLSKDNDEDQEESKE